MARATATAPKKSIPMELELPEDFKSLTGTLITFKVRLKDKKIKKPVFFFEKRPPLGAHLARDGTFTWIPAAWQKGKHTFRFRAVTSRGHSGRRALVIFLDDVLPRLTILGADQNNPMAPFFEWTRPVDGAGDLVQQFYFTYEDASGNTDLDIGYLGAALPCTTSGGESTVQPDPTTAGQGIFSWTLNAKTDPGYYTITITVTDSGGNTTLQTVIIHIKAPAAA
jgi:hypothetical protein